MADKKYVSGEEYQALKQAGSSRGRQVTLDSTWLGVAAAVVVLCGLSFWGGMAYQKHHSKTVVTAASSRGNGFGGFGGGGARRSGGFGQVTAISSTSISVQNQRSGTTNTYSITGSTSISDNGQTVTASDIQTGDTVIIMTSGSGSTTATSILVNPSFGGGAGSGGGFGGTSQINPGGPDVSSPVQTN